MPCRCVFPTHAASFSLLILSFCLRRYCPSATVWLTIDAKDGVLKTAEHEAMHLRLEAEPGLRERLIDALGLSQEQRDKLARKYCEAYEGCYTGEDLSAYLDEIVCDSLLNGSQRALKDIICRINKSLVAASA